MVSPQMQVLPSMDATLTVLLSPVGMAKVTLPRPGPTGTSILPPRHRMTSVVAFDAW